MNEQDTNQSVAGDTKKNRVLYGIGAFLFTIAVFGLGWLAGADRLSINDGSLGSLLNQSSSQINVNELEEILEVLQQNYDGTVDEQAFIEGMKRGAVASVGDTYTEYLTAEETNEFNAGLNGTFEGIGAELGLEGNFVIIISPIKGTPADRAGVQAGDIIIAIDDQDATGISVTEAVKRIRGEKGTEVKLTVIRNGEQLDIPIIRDTIDVPSVEWKVENNIGIITINQFGTDTVELTRQAAQELKDAGVSGVVLDVRGNPGGLLDAAVGVSSVWLDKGSVVLEEKRGDKVIKTFKTTTAPILSDIPTVVLINQGSASASEIVAGALRDNGRATLVGTTSFGKGSVQQLIPLQSGGSVKVTIARWFTPAGKNIDKEGIAPDQEVERTPEDREANRDPQLDAAIQSLR